MRTLRLSLSAALGLALVIALAAPALGAPAVTAPKPAETATKSAAASAPVDAAAGGPIDVQIWPGQGGETAFITVVEVDAKAKLPVTVRIPIIPGSTVEWAGEILGGSAEGDVAVPYKLIQGRGGQFAELVLTKSHRGQIDAIGFPLKVSSEALSVSVDYVQTVSSPLTAISVRIPANVSKVKITPRPKGDPVVNVDGESLYSLEPKVYESGEKQTVTLSYSTVPPVEPAPGAELNPVLIGLGIALAIVVVVMIILVRRQRPAEQTAEQFEGGDQSESETSLAGSNDDDAPAGEDDDEPDLDFE